MLPSYIHYNTFRDLLLLLGVEAEHGFVELFFFQGLDVELKVDQQAETLSVHLFVGESWRDLIGPHEYLDFECIFTILTSLLLLFRGTGDLWLN